MLKLTQHWGDISDHGTNLVLYSQQLSQTFFDDCREWQQPKRMTCFSHESKQTIHLITILYNFCEISLNLTIISKQTKENVFIKKKKMN